MASHSCKILRLVTSSKIVMKDCFCFLSTSESVPAIFLFPLFFYSLTLKLMKMTMPSPLLHDHQQHTNTIKDRERCSYYDVKHGALKVKTGLLDYQLEYHFQLDFSLTLGTNSDYNYINFLNKENIQLFSEVI